MNIRAYVSVLGLFMLVVLRTILGPPDLGALIPLVGMLVVFGAAK